MRATTHPLLLLLCALAMLATGCGAGGGGRGGIAPPKPQEIPPPAPPRDVPVDPALQASAKEVLIRSLGAQNPAQRAHAIEGLRETQGEAAAPQILPALADGSPMVRFAAALAAGELRLPKPPVQ